MNTITNPPVRTFYVAHTPETGIVHYGYVDPHQSVTADQAEFEIFTDEALYGARLIELDQDYQVSQDLSEVPLEQQRILLCRAVNKIRAEKLGLPVTFMGFPFDADTEAIGNINGVLAAVGAGVPLPHDFSWRASNNVNVPMGPHGIVGLAATMLVYRNRCYGVSWALKSALQASEHPLTIDIQAGWPDPRG